MGIVEAYLRDAGESEQPTVEQTAQPAAEQTDRKGWSRREALSSGAKAWFLTTQIGALLNACTPQEKSRVGEEAPDLTKEQLRDLRIERVKALTDPTEGIELDQQTQSLKPKDIERILHKIFAKDGKYNDLKEQLTSLDQWEQLMGIEIHYGNDLYDSVADDRDMRGDLTVYQMENEEGGFTRRPLIELTYDEEGKVKSLQILEAGTRMETVKERLQFSNYDGKTKYSQVRHMARAEGFNKDGVEVDYTYEAFFRGERIVVEEAMAREDHWKVLFDETRRTPPPSQGSGIKITS